MEICERLQANSDQLFELYHSNLEDILNLQDTLIYDVLPSVSDELELSPEATEWAKDWLHDTSSIFRISKRNKFTRSFALESIRKNLIWRLSNLWPLASPLPMLNLHCLPADIRDRFGRPVLVVDVAAPSENTNALKPYILQAFERLRVHLKKLFDDAGPRKNHPPLQYVILLDLKAVSLQNINIDLFTWVLREVIPRFPGMLGAVFVMNYSWTHSGMWSIIKRILPQNALSRLFFPSREDLVLYFSPSVLPRDYGGTLPFLADLEDPLAAGDVPSAASEFLENPGDIGGISTSLPQPAILSMAAKLSPTSLLNPFFGYPASASPNRGSPFLHHGRRRKRDLARTLALLFWLRWHNQIAIGFCLAVLIFIVKYGPRRGYFRFLQRIGR